MFGTRPSGQPDINMLARTKEKIAAGSQNCQSFDKLTQACSLILDGLILLGMELVAKRVDTLV